MLSINALTNNLTQLLPELAQYDCIVNGMIFNLAEIEKSGLNNFFIHAKNNMPKKLYKYFPNKWVNLPGKKKPINYSLQALENNTVYLQSPDLFDDVYDSSINIDHMEYVTRRLKIYYNRCLIKKESDLSPEQMIFALSNVFYDAIQADKDINDAFKINPENKCENLQNQIFSMSVMEYLNKTDDWNSAITNALDKEFQEFEASLQKTFRTACFSTTPFSQLMWGGAYADNHTGFCIEYNIDTHVKELKDIYFNLYPMIYCKTRTDITDKIIQIQDNNYNEQALWDIYFNGALRKSIDWFFQDEWRLLLPKGMTDYNVKFYPIGKVYLGHRMDKQDRKEIIDICNNKNIPYVGVTRNKNKFEMQECDFLCEDCQKFTNQ